MKLKLLSLIVAILSIGIFSSGADAQSFILNRYFPLGQGNTLLFAETGEQSKSTALQAVLGAEVVRLVPTQQVWYWKSSSLLEITRSSLAWNPFRGLGRHKDAQFQGLEQTGYCIYDTPEILLPKTMEVGETFQGSSSYTRYDAGDNEIASGTSERELTLAGMEEVTVRAGTFAECLKFTETVSWEEGQASYGSCERTFWLAPDVGLVKWYETVSETIIGQGETSTAGDWELFLGYVGRELIVPTAPPEASSGAPRCGMTW